MSTIVAKLILYKSVQVQSFISDFLELEVSRMFKLSISIPRKPGKIEYIIELEPTGDTVDLNETFIKLLKHSFQDGMLIEWNDIVKFI